MKNRSLLIIFFLVVGCGPRKLDFERPADTRSRPITLQAKRSYDFPQQGLSFHNRFDGARLNGVTQVNDSVYSISVMPENTPINNSAYYAFAVNSQIPQTIYLRFDYPEGYTHRYVPKQNWRQGWRITPEEDLTLVDSIPQLKLNDVYGEGIIAAQELQNSSHVAKWVEESIENKPYIEWKTIGTTTLGRPMWVLDMTRGPSKEKPLVVFFTRQHPPEVTGYFAFQAFMKEVMGESDTAKAFLEKYRVLAFPLVNPDGVDLGHWRHNAGGIDTNRDWGKYRQPEIKSIVNYIHKAKKESKGKVVLGLDFHSTWYDVFYTNKERKATPFPKFLDQWFQALESSIPNYKVNEKASNSTQPVSKGWLLYGHNAVGVTYEIGDETPREDIQLIGKTSAQALMYLLTFEE